MTKPALFFCLLALATAGCSLVGLGRGPCPAAPPSLPVASELSVVPVELDSFYRRLEALAGDAPAFELVRVPAGKLRLPLVHVGPVGDGKRRLLVVAGLNGDEVSASLAALSLLADVRRSPKHYEGVALHLVAPANPGGFAQLSAGNAAGCDVSRDFGPFQTLESRAIAGVLHSVRPDLVVSLRDALAEEMRVTGSESVPPSLVRSAGDAVVDEGVPLVRPGSRFLFFGESALADGQGSLASYGERLGIGTLVSEAPGASEDLRMRIGGHLAAVRAAARYLRLLPPPADRE